MYLREIKHDLLTAREEVHLAQRLEMGLEASSRLSTEEVISPLADQVLKRIAEQGNRAQRRLTDQNLRLVVSVARKYLGRGFNLDGRIQDGNISLLRAVG